MYRSGPGDRVVGGKMLKITTVLLFMIYSLSALACWKVQGTLAVDGEVWKINQKINHDKEYGFPMGPFIYKMTISKGEGKKHKVVYKLEEKKGLKLELITFGSDEVEPGNRREIFAKGEKGQPNTIITLKIQDI